MTIPQIIVTRLREEGKYTLQKNEQKYIGDVVALLKHQGMSMYQFRNELILNQRK